MERSEWLSKVRAQAETAYDHFAPAYWVKYGKYSDATHRLFVKKLLGRLGPRSAVLDAACGAGRYDGLLVEPGHSVLGVDQSAGMLARAREHFPEERFPQLRYEKLGLQELSFEAEFDGAICLDAMEHDCPEDWPGILARFQRALKPGGLLYVTVDAASPDEDRAAYERARAMGLPVVPGEIADELDDAYAEATAVSPLDPSAPFGTRLDHSVYHFHPTREQVRAWFAEAGLAIEEEGTGDDYAHFLVRKNQ